MIYSLWLQPYFFMTQIAFTVFLCLQVQIEGLYSPRTEYLQIWEIAPLAIQAYMRGLRII